MEKPLHIVFGDSARGTLMHYYKNRKSVFRGEVAALMDDWSFGPIHELDTREGWERRMLWLKEAMDSKAADRLWQDPDLFERIRWERYFLTAQRDRPIILWQGRNASDEVAVPYLASLLEDRELYWIDVSRHNLSDKPRTVQRARAAGECSERHFDRLLQEVRPLSQKDLVGLKGRWDRLRGQTGTLRVLGNPGVEEAPESFFDRFLLSEIGEAWEEVFRVMGRVMGKTSHLVGDVFLKYRIARLAEAGRVETDPDGDRPWRARVRRSVE